MAITKKIICCVAFSLVCLFLPIGYAKLSNDLLINSSIEANPPNTVYITSVMITNTSGVEANLSSINLFSTTLVDSSVTLGSDSTSTVNMQITVYNNTGETYGFSAIKYAIGETTYDNDKISIKALDIKVRDQIDFGQYLTFTVQFYYNSSDTSNTKLNSLVQYEFLPINEIPEDSGEIAAKDAMEKFKEILDSAETFDTLTGQMDDYNSNERLNSSYIGNLSGSSESDLQLIEEMFDGKLLININGVDTEVTLMIKRENLDGNTATGDENGNEMTIYMTTDSLDTIWGTVTVYAAVYTKTASSNGWFQIGELFEGTSRINGYGGEWLGTGSFNTDLWKSTTGKTIEEIISQYSY